MSRIIVTSINKGAFRGPLFLSIINEKYNEQ